MKLSLWTRALAINLAILGSGFAGTSRAAPPLSVYGNLPGFEMAAISPAGDHVGLIGTADGKRQLMILSGGKILTSMVIDHDTKVWDLLWAGNGLLLLRTSNTATLGAGFTTDKAELFAMTVFPLNGEKAWSIFEGDRYITGGIRGFYGVTMREGKWFGYFGGMTLQKNETHETISEYLPSTNPILYEVDLQTGKKKSIADRTDRDDVRRRWLVDADGKASVSLDFASKAGSWTIRNGANKAIASGVDPLGTIDLVGYGSTPGTVIYSQEDTETGRDRWYEMPIAGGERKEILQDEDVSQALFDRRTHALIGYRLNGDFPTYRFFDTYQAKVVAATQKAFPGHSVQLIEWNDAFDRLIVRTEGEGDPQNWWVVDIKTGKAEQIGMSYPIPAKDVGSSKVIQYKAADGMDIGGVLTLPPSRPSKNLPVVVLPHGGPGARDYPGFDWWAQAFAARGYAVLQPNFRGSTGYGAAFERAGHGEWGRKMQTDISDGLSQLVKDGIVDAKRACIVGASYGGYTALAGVTLQQGLYRCAVSFAGVSDPGKLIVQERSRSNANETLMRSLKQEMGSSRDLDAVSPVRFAAQADAPILLIHGKDDTVVRFDQSNDMAAALRRANKPVELVALPEGDHWLSKSETRLAMLQSTVAFVEKYNPPDQAPQ